MKFIGAEKSAELTRMQRAWYRLPLGCALLHAERTCMAEVLADLFGYHLVQIGGVCDPELLASSRIAHRVVLDADIGASDATMLPALYARADALPLRSDSVDVLVLPHTLEFETDPHQVLREAERVLIAEGNVVILGFNPWSLWGLWHLFLARKGAAPWAGRFISLARVRDWLAVLGFDEVKVQPYFFRPALHHAGIMRRLDFMEAAGARWWPLCGGAYALIARKRVSTMTPIKPRWIKQRAPVRSRVAEPLLRNGRKR